MLRSLLVALCVTVSAIFIASVVSADPSGGRRSAVSTDNRSGNPSGNQLPDVADQPAMTLDGIAVAHADAGRWYAHAGAELDRAAAAREAARNVARYSRPVITARPAPMITGNRCGYADPIRSIWERDAEWAIGIAWRESRCTPGAASRTGCLGLFQMCWPLHQAMEQAICGRSDRAGMFDADCNTRMAWHLYKGSGQRPWRL